jgi:predicted double-glycine peptidase
MKGFSQPMYAVFIACASFAYLSALFPSTTMAGDTVILTHGDIQTFEKCPVRTSKQLRCSTYFQTTSYTCGPAAIMTVMNYYGKLGRGQLNHQTEMNIAKEMGTDESGTSTTTMTSYLDHHGFSADSGEYVSTNTLMSYIDKQEPVIVGFDSHWLVAIGYNKATDGNADHDEILFSDSCCNRRVIDRATLDSTWQDGHMPNNHCGGNGNYIVAIPA